MDNNQNEKKPRRPRIGQAYPGVENDSADRQRFERVNYNQHATSPEGAETSAEEGGYQKRPYTPRPNSYNNNRQGGGYNRYGNQGYNNGGYGNRQQGGYNRYGNNHGYVPRAQQPEFASDASSAPETAQAEGAEANAGASENTGYAPRQNNYRQGGYNNRYNNGGYNNRQGGYNNGGAYGQNRQGGYQNRPGGYNNRNNGGYNNQNRQGGYNQNRQGGYGNREGGYNNQNRQSGYGNGQNAYNKQNRYNNQNRQGGYNQNRQGGNGSFPGRGKSFTPRPKRIEYEMPIPDPNEQMRLNKFMSNAGICSRREADEFIQQGLVKVNGVVVTELGTKISHSDVVEYDEKVVTMQSKCYILLNKPKDCVTTSDDPNGRLTVMDIVKGACPERIYPVGRLDRNTTGVLLLTNDGDLASKLTHPKYVKKKIYHVWCDRDISEDDMQRIADGIELEDGPIHADAISYATETDRNQAGIEIHSGRNRIVRRIFESLGYHVTKLDRVYFAGLTKKNLPRGRWRYLTQEEVNYLKMGSFE